MYSTGISELMLKVDDVAPIAAFYRDVVGLTPELEPTAKSAWFWTGEPGASTRFAISTGRASLADVLPLDEHAPLPEAERWTRTHFAFQVPLEHAEAAAQRMRDHGVPIFGPVTLGWMRAIGYYFWDPAGHLVEFWSPLDDDEG
jgi:catechol 2,3-dioxygenase-like lactoylglutathione lyase family enzyme